MLHSHSPRLALEDVQRLIAPQEGPTCDLPSSADVVIIGAGPIGLTAANLLGSMGIDAVVLEQNAVTADLPRALLVDDEYMRLLASLGLLDAVAPHSSPPFGIHFVGMDGRPLIKVRPFRTPNGFHNRNGVMQPLLEKVLLEGAKRFSNLRVSYRRKLLRIVPTSSGYDLTYLAGSEERTLATRFILGCDGSRSFVRGELQIPFDGERIEEPHLVLDLADFPDDAPHSRFFCNPRRPFNSIPTPYGGRRIEFMLMPGDDANTIATESSTRRLIDRFTPYKGAKITAIRRVVYSYSARIARTMHKDQAFLLGDAAHVMPPFGASAMNTGARDAANLCWKLGMVLRNEAGDSLLHTYDTERREQVKNIISYSVRIGRLANIHSVMLAWLRDKAIRCATVIPAIRSYFEEMRYMPKPFLRHGFVLHEDNGSSRIGRTFPRLKLIGPGGEQTNFDAVAGKGFVLVGVDAAKADLDEIGRHPLIARLHPKILSLATGSEPGAFRILPDDVLKTDSSSAGIAMLVRPDRYVAAAGTKRTLITHLGRLTSILE